jgi:hypothetical protein
VASYNIYFADRKKKTLLGQVSFWEENLPGFEKMRSELNSTGKYSASVQRLAGRYDIAQDVVYVDPTQPAQAAEVRKHEEVHQAVRRKMKVRPEMLSIEEGLAEAVSALSLPDDWVISDLEESSRECLSYLDTSPGNFLGRRLAGIFIRERVSGGGPPEELLAKELRFCVYRAAIGPFLEFARKHQEYDPRCPASASLVSDLIDRGCAALSKKTFSEGLASIAGEKRKFARVRNPLDETHQARYFQGPLSEEMKRKTYFEFGITELA